MMDQMMFAHRVQPRRKPSTDVNAPMNLFDGDDVHRESNKDSRLIRNLSRTSARNVTTRPLSANAARTSGGVPPRFKCSTSRGVPTEAWCNRCNRLK